MLPSHISVPRAQTCFSTDHKFGSTVATFVESLTLDGQPYLCTTMFFREPSTICSAGSSSANATGDGLWLARAEGEPLALITDLQAPPAAPWLKGKCFPTMGVHYWYALLLCTIRSFARLCGRCTLLTRFLAYFCACCASNLSSSRYNLSTSMDCTDIFPVFLLYNGGMLNAWGWVFASAPLESGGGRWENPSGAPQAWLP